MRLARTLALTTATPLALATVIAAPAAAATPNCASLPKPTNAQGLTAEAQLRLNALGSALAPDGAHGPKTRAALTAWEQRNKRPADGRLSPADLTVLREQTRGGYAVTVDKDTQRLTVTRGGRQVARLVTSTATGQWYKAKRRDGSTYVARALTPNGSFVAGRREAGWYQSPLGCLYQPIFLRKPANAHSTGIAIHGSNTVTGAPASHGCIRTRPATQAGLAAVLGDRTPITVTGADPAARNTPQTPTD